MWLPKLNQVGGDLVVIVSLLFSITKEQIHYLILVGGEEGGFLNLWPIKLNTELTEVHVFIFLQVFGFIFVIV